MSTIKKQRKKTVLTPRQVLLKKYFGKVKSFGDGLVYQLAIRGKS
jgi:hypothetical protein